MVNEEKRKEYTLNFTEEELNVISAALSTAKFDGRRLIETVKDEESRHRLADRIRKEHVIHGYILSFTCSDAEYSILRSEEHFDKPEERERFY